MCIRVYESMSENNESFERSLRHHFVGLFFLHVVHLACASML